MSLLEQIQGQPCSSAGSYCRPAWGPTEVKMKRSDLLKCIRSAGPKMAPSLAREGELGIREITYERGRQLGDEGWHAAHDDEHTAGELALAAICYAAPKPVIVKRGRCQFDPWPWDEEWDKRPKGRPEERGQADRVRCLVKAGALIAAEIDRVVRLSEEEYKEIYG